VIISWQAEPPTGREGLSRLAATATNSIVERIS